MVLSVGVKPKPCSFKTKNGMKFSIPPELLAQAEAHAKERGMTLEEYIAEFIGMVKDEQDKELNKKHRELGNEFIPDEV